ncbi:MAG: dodecin domain-containing protein, partial [Alkalispirochaeta sp.]
LTGTSEESFENAADNAVERVDDSSC